MPNLKNSKKKLLAILNFGKHVFDKIKEKKRCIYMDMDIFIYFALAIMVFEKKKKNLFEVVPCPLNIFMANFSALAFPEKTFICN